MVTPTLFKIYNTLNRQEETVKPIQPGKISMYTCGPTVYSQMQFGNLRIYVEWDIFQRALMYLGYEVKRYMNITDVGHMTSDENFGDDKVEKMARKEGVQPLDIADKYIVTILQDFQLMNVMHPDGTSIHLSENIVEKELSDESTAKIPANLSQHGWIRATDEVDAMIEMIKKIEKNGFTYETDQALYYDVTKYSDYTALSGQKLEDKRTGVRDEVVVDPDKRHPADFVLWMKNVRRYKDHVMKWESPWGVGFPGWHIECSAMASKYLGERFDIHTGGVDHISVHHPNERAQNFAALGHTSVNYWVHGEFITALDGEKLSKSKGNAFTLDELVEEGFEPMDLRYYFLTASYRQQMIFSLDGLKSARQSRLRLIYRLAVLYNKSVEYSNVGVDESWVRKFKEAWADDLNSAKALAVLAGLLNMADEMQKQLKNGQSSENVDVLVKTVLEFDRVFGLRLEQSVKDMLDVPAEVFEMVERRELARQGKDYEEADKIREELKSKGYKVVDGVDGSYVLKC